MGCLAGSISYLWLAEHTFELIPCLMVIGGFSNRWSVNNVRIRHANHSTFTGFHACCNKLYYPSAQASRVM